MKLKPLRSAMCACLLTLASCYVVPGLTAQTSVQTSLVFVNDAPTYVDTVTGVLTITGTMTTPTGNVSYQVDGGSTLTAPLNAQGLARLDITPQKPGSHSVTWSYGGDAGNQGASGSKSYTTTDLPAAPVGSSYPLRPLIYTQVEGNGYSSFGGSGVAIDAIGDTFLTFGGSASGVAPSVAEITAGLDYKVLPVSGIGTDTQIALDGAGNLYIADPTHSRIVEYTAGGVQQALSVTGLQTPVSLSYEASSNSLYILDQGVGAVISYDLTHSTQSTLFKAPGMDSPIATDGQGGVYYGQGPHLYLWNRSNGPQEIFNQFDPASAPIGSDPTIQGLAYDVNRQVLWVAVAGQASTSVIYALDARDHMLAFMSDSGQGSGGTSGQIALDAAGHLYGTEDVFTLGSAINEGPVINEKNGVQVYFTMPYAATNTTDVAQVYGAMTLESPEPTGTGLGTTSWPFLFLIPGAAQAINVPVYGKGYGVWDAVTPGSTSSLQVTLSQPGGIANVDPFIGFGDNVYVTDTANNTVSLIQWTPSQGGPNVYKTQTLGFTGLQQPAQVAADGANDVWVMDHGGAGGGTRIVELNSAGVQTVVYPTASGVGALSTVTAFAEYGDYLYIGGTIGTNGVIERLDGIGAVRMIASAIATPAVLAAGADGDVYAMDAGGTDLLHWDQAGNISHIAQSLPPPTQLSVAADSTVYLSSAAASDVLLIAPDGTQTHLAIPGTTNPAYAVADDQGNVSFIDGSTKTVKLNTRSVFVEQDFGTTALNTTAKIGFTITNVGNLTVGAITPANVPPFTLVGAGNNPCALSGATSIAPGQSCGLEMQYVPTKLQSDSAVISLSSRVSGVANCCDLLSDVFDVTGKGGNVSASPNPALTPASIDFGNVTLNTTTQAQVATVINTGNAALTLSGITLMGGNAASFSETNNCGTSVAAGSSCAILITCTPTIQGKLNAILTANYPAPLLAQTSALTCTGTQASAPQAALTPSSVNFANTAIGTSSTPQTFTLTNAGSAALPITSVALGGTNAGSFAIGANNCGSSLTAGNSCSVAVTFSPSGSGDFSATLVVVDSVGTQTSTLAGAGIAAAAPQAALTPASANFAGVTVGSSSAAQILTLSNAGNAVLPITSISITGANASAFLIASNTCGTSLAAGAPCTISISFHAAAPGQASATLSVVDSVGTQSASLTGTGIATGVAADFTLMGKPASQTAARGTAVSFTLLLGSADPNNPFTQMVNLVATGLPAGATVAFAPNSVVPGATNAATSTMTVTISTLTAQVDRGSHDGIVLAGVSVTSLLLCFGLPRTRRRRSLRLLMFAIFTVGVVATSLTGCGSGTGFAPPGSTSTITVTGTSDNIVHSTTLTLVVK